MIPNSCLILRKEFHPTSCLNWCVAFWKAIRISGNAFLKKFSFSKKVKFKSTWRVKFFSKIPITSRSFLPLILSSWVIFCSCARFKMTARSELQMKENFCSSICNALVTIEFGKFRHSACSSVHISRILWNSCEVCDILRVIPDSLTRRFFS